MSTTIYATASYATDSDVAARLGDRFSSLGGSDFMALLLAQLRNQNPLEPMEDRDLMGQVAQLNSVQELRQINESLQALAGSNELLNAAGLIGKTVRYFDADGNLVEGQVLEVEVLADQVLLKVGQELVPLSAVSAVAQPEA